MLAIFQAVRFHFIPLVGSVISLLLWSKLSAWKSRTDFRMGVFLLLLFWGLLYMHAMASIVKELLCFLFYSLYRIF